MSGTAPSISKCRCRREQAVIFTCNGQLIGERARTLREFVTIQERLPAAADRLAGAPFDGAHPKICVFACSVIAMTAGCLSRRSAVIA